MEKYSYQEYKQQTECYHKGKNKVSLLLPRPFLGCSCTNSDTGTVNVGFPNQTKPTGKILPDHRWNLVLFNET